MGRSRPQVPPELGVVQSQVAPRLDAAVPLARLERERQVERGAVFSRPVHPHAVVVGPAARPPVPGEDLDESRREPSLHEGTPKGAIVDLRSWLTDYALSYTRAPV